MHCSSRQGPCLNFIPASSGLISHFLFFLMAKEINTCYQVTVLSSLSLTSVDPAISVIPPDDHFHGIDKISFGPRIAE